MHRHPRTPGAPAPPVAVLVDAYVSGRYLQPEFAALGADVLHVQGTPALMPSMPPPDLSVYAANIVHESVDQTVSELSVHRPVCVIAGQEPGVRLADILAERLGVPTNGTALSPARRDKYLMAETLREAGLRCAEQTRGADPEALARWADRRGDWPVVVKPLRSAASDSVVVCGDAAQVREAAKAVLAAKTVYQEPNTEALVQSYLRGTEYVVDMVSRDGRRYVVGVWEYHKRLLRSGRNIYDRERLLPAGQDPVPELTAYVADVLDALGVRHGPSHAEVVMTPDGPALVEVGTRISGNMHPGFHDRCAGANQATLTALAYLHPDQFLARYAGRGYTRLAEGVCGTTSTTRHGVVESVDEAVVAEITRLPTVYGLNLKIEPGQIIRPTVDLYSSTMRIFLCAEDREAVERDWRRIEQLKDHVYRIRSDQEDA